MAISRQSATTSNSPSTTPSLAIPAPRFIASSSLDYLLIAAVEALRHSSHVASERLKAVEKELREAELLPQLVIPAKENKPISSVVAGTSTSEAAGVNTVDEQEEAVRVRLETIGSHVGASFIERLSVNRSIFQDPLDAIKFVCKDLWTACWDKQVDNLRTNHRGVYVLQDNGFKPISRISGWDGRQDTVKRAKLFTALPAGMIRGALRKCGFPGTVGTEVSIAGSGTMGCTFQVKLPKT